MIHSAIYYLAIEMFKSRSKLTALHPLLTHQVIKRYTKSLAALPHGLLALRSGDSLHVT